mmetsp:Transcript_8295/g.22141  ORF Transcript_8295/g.22141 Transcript_8295/m.22141 type:complete len:369 (-) Transcript_8295:95-1201(-)
MHRCRLNIVKWTFYNFVALICLPGKGSDAIKATRLRPGALNTEGQGFLFGVSYDMQTYEKRVLVQLNLSNASLLLEINEENGTATFTGFDDVLTHQQKAKLFSLHRWRSLKFGMKDIISKLARYSADAPTKHTFSLHRVSIKPGRRSGVSCLTEGHEANAVWTDSNGTLHNVSVIVGSTAGPNYGCMGRCGKGCPKHNKSKVVYTQKCLNHDQCSLESRSHNGMRDKECGEEYKRAMPDYLWGDKTCKRRQKMRKKTTRADHLDASTANASDDAANASDENVSDDGAADEGAAAGDGPSPSEGYDGAEAKVPNGGRSDSGDASREAGAAVEDVEDEEDEEDTEDQELSGGGISKEDLAHIIDAGSFDE